MSAPLTAESRHLKLRLVQLEDAEFILALRTDERLNQFVSAVEPDLKKQVDWLASYKAREAIGVEYYFIVEGHDRVRLGTVRLYDFVDCSFCWGSWIINKGSPAFAAIESALLVYDLGFYTLNFARSHFEVRKANRKVVEYHKRFGAMVIREDELNYYFRFEEQDYRIIRKRYERYLPARGN